MSTNGNQVRVLTWQDVATARGSEQTVVYRDGRIQSIVCGSEQHKDARVGRTVEYAIPNRPFFQKFIVAMRQAEESGQALIVYWKLAKNQWEDLGSHIVVGHREARDSVIFGLTAIGD